MHLKGHHGRDKVEQMVGMDSDRSLTDINLRIQVLIESTEEGNTPEGKSEDDLNRKEKREEKTNQKRGDTSNSCKG